MKENKQQVKRTRGAQPGNQNARTHGRYSLVIPPRTAEVLKAVAGLDTYGQRVIYTWLLEHLLKLKSDGLLESHSFPPVPEKAEPIPPQDNLYDELRACIEKQNINFDDFMNEAIKMSQS
jgi:hypothetical protein